MIAGRWTFCTLLCPVLTVPLPGFAYACVLFPGKPSIQHQDISFFIICCATKDAHLWSALSNAAPSFSIPPPDDVQPVLSDRTWNAAGQQHLLQLGVINQVRARAGRRVFQDDC